MNAKFLVLGELSLKIKIGKVKQQSPWQPYRWQVLDQCPASEFMPVEFEDVVQSLSIGVYQDQLQGYFLNLDTDQPFVFFGLRYPEDNKTLRPHVFDATFSYDEAARWMDSNEEVQTLPMPTAVARWLAELVDVRYQPESKQRRRPQSFISPKDRGQGGV